VHTLKIFEEEYMKKWLAIPIVLLLAVVMILGSCKTAEKTTAPPTQPPTQTTAPPTSTTPTKAPPTGTITAVIASFGYESFDPNVLGTGLWGSCIFDTLVRTKEDMSFTGSVADSWSISDNGCVWTFKIHKGIKFSNGDPLTAADVKYSVDRYGALTSGSAWSRYISTAYNKVDSKVIDDYTFEYDTAYAESTLLACFGNTWILDKAVIDKVGEKEYFKAPIGSGPWKFVELVSKTSLKLVANTDYWRPNEVPAYQYYVELCVPEQATRINMLKTGECDMAYGVDYDRFKELKTAGFSLQLSGINGTSSLAFQGTWFPEANATGDINIRKAMSFALNRQEICDTWYQGYAVPGGQFFEPKGVFGYTDALTADAYNPTLAKTLIKDAGYPDKFKDPTIHLYCPSSAQNYMLLLMSYWQAVGLQVKLEVVDLTVYYSYLFHNFAGRIQETDKNVGWIWEWSSWSYPNSVYHCANMYTSGGVHGTGNDPVADQMYSEVTHQKDYQIAAQKMAAFQLYVKGLYINIGVVEYQPWYIYSPKTLGAWNGRNWEGIYTSIGGIQHPAK